jgi:hypothetical protein
MAREFDTALQLPEDYYKPIGEFIFRWAQLEYQMQEIVWRSLGVDNKTGRTLTIGMSARTLAAMLRTLTKQWLTHPTEKQWANSIARGVGGLAKFRNLLVHGSWEFPKGGDPNDIYMIYMKEPDHRILPRAKKHEPPEIIQKTIRLKRLNDTAQKLIYRLDARQKP